MAEARLHAAPQAALRGDDPRRRSRRSSATRTTMQVPRLDKIVLNMGVGEAMADTKKVHVGRRAIWR